MAVSLKARISLVDKFSSPMRSIDRQLDKTGKSISRMQRHTIGMGNSIGSLTRKLNPLNSGFMGIAAAAGAAYSAIKIFNNTVGEAMKLQQSQIVIGAMFDDKQLSKEYMKMIDKFSIKSPLMDSQTMYGNSKSFITQTKDIDQLEKMWGLTERLMASDPQQGLEGAIFALRELFSGDAISIVDRFELPRKVMNDIKKLPLDEQLTALDKYFDKIGLTTKLINDMGGSALGMWSQVKERFQLVLRDMGEPSLKAISTFLGGLIDRLEGEDMQKFANWGGRVIENMITGLTTNSIKLYDWFTGLANSEEFKSKTTLFGKVDFIVADVADKLRVWFDNGGKDKIMKFGADITETMLGILNNSQAFIEVGVNLGNSLAQGIFQGIENSAKSSKLGKFLSTGMNLSPAGLIYNGQKSFKEKGVFEKASRALDKNLSKSHSAGLDRVPYSGYQPTLHKDEKILNAQEAREYRKGGKGSGNIYNFNIAMDGSGSMKQKARELLKEMAILIEQEGGQMT